MPRDNAREIFLEQNMELFCTFIVEVVTEIHTCIKIHRTVYKKQLHYMLILKIKCGAWVVKPVE